MGISEDSGDAFYRLREEKIGVNGVKITSREGMCGFILRGECIILERSTIRIRDDN